METTRLSMNSSLKDARIFDDDSWDAESAGFVKHEPSPSDDEFIENEAQAADKFSGNAETAIKRESSDDEFMENAGDVTGKTETAIIKSEPPDGELMESDIFGDDPWKPAGICNNLQLPEDQVMPKDTEMCGEDPWEPANVKQEPYDPVAEIKREKLSPVPMKNNKNELKADRSNSPSDSPFNKTFFSNLHIKQEQFNSPIKTEDSDDSSPRKSVKRTIFTRDAPYIPTSIPEEISRNYQEGNPRLYIKSKLGKSPVKTEYSSTGKSAKRTVFSRESPYKKSYDSCEEGSSKSNIKLRLGPPVNDEEKEVPRKKTKKVHRLETDQATLKRRQKQIDFGKNTIGYDNYIKQVPRDKRAADDPQTPNKYEIYSRRGFDGLIKQWRLRLHKYDPDDT